MMKAISTIFLMLALMLNASAKRLGPADVPPVVTETAVYSAPHFAEEGGKQIRGGLVEARDPATKKLLWKVRVYRTKYDPNLEADVQDVFIKTLSFDETQRLLILSDEMERVFVIDPKTRKVTRVR